MNPRSMKQAFVWGGALILVGILALVSQFVELNLWVWVVVFAAAALGALALYLTDRSDWRLLLATYALWFMTILLLLAALEWVPDVVMPFYVLTAIAIPFLVVYLRNRALWWPLIPAYALVAIAVMILLQELGVLDDLLVPAYVMFVIALPFYFVYLRNRKQWWPLIPAAVLTVVGLSFLLAQGGIEILAAVVLVLAGGAILVRMLIRGGPAGEAIPPEAGGQEPVGPESEGQGEEAGQ